MTHVDASQSPPWPPASARPRRRPRRSPRTATAPTPAKPATPAMPPYIALALALVTMLGSTIASVLSWLESRDATLASHANAAGIAQTARDTAKNATGIAGVHVLLNSQLSAWKLEIMEANAAAVTAALERGIAQGQAQERDRTSRIVELPPGHAAGPRAPPKPDP